MVYGININSARGDRGIYCSVLATSVLNTQELIDHASCPNPHCLVSSQDIRPYVTIVWL